jgi:tRNA-Thr(GGU) m(6)t(6)A37 methyltransferase TsaA
MARGDEMADTVQMKIIAKLRSDFPTKFGIPRQSGIVDNLKSRIVFEPEYRDENALRGLEGFSHLWIIWQFSGAVRQDWSPTVRPPRLGGNTRLGVFATRSPFRPNSVGLSSVRIVKLERTSDEGTVIWVSGADLMDGTPIFDIKPYLPYTDSHPDAAGGFTDRTDWHETEVVFPEKLLELIPENKRAGLIGVLRQNPCPTYKTASDRVYGMEFGNFDIGFVLRDGIIQVESVIRRDK